MSKVRRNFVSVSKIIGYFHEYSILLFKEKGHEVTTHVKDALVAGEKLVEEKVSHVKEVVTGLFSRRIKSVSFLFLIVLFLLDDRKSKRSSRSN